MEAQKKLAPGFVRSLERVLQQEIKYHRNYIALLKDQRSIVTSFKQDKLEALDKRRADLLAEMQRLHEQRLSLMAQFPSGDERRLSTLAQKHLPKLDAARICSLVEELREVVKESQNVGSEYGALVGFAMNLIHGSLSLFYQARQSLTKSYSKKGKVEENSTPNKSRKENLIKSA